MKLLSEIRTFRDRVTGAFGQLTSLRYRKCVIAIALVVPVESGLSTSTWPVSQGPQQRGIQLLLQDNGSLPLGAEPVVQQVYRENAYRPLWTEKEQISPRGRELISLLSGCEEYGLFPSDFCLSEICSLKANSLTAENSARLDILLTDCFVVLLHQLDTERLTSVQ